MSRPKKWLPALAAAGLALVLYAAAIPGQYIYDDVPMIGQDQRVHSPAHWGQIWTQNYNGGADNLYRPLTLQTYAVQWWVNGDRPWAFRLVNVLLNAGVAAGVAELARRLMGMKAALAAGLLFAAHPIHVEAVVAVVGRAEEMCAIFTIGGLLLFLHRPLTGGRVAAISACALAAMLSKEQGMLFPFLLLALGLLARGEGRSEREKKAMQWLVVMLCGCFSGLMVLREDVLNLPFEWDKIFLDTSIQPLALSGPADRAMMVFVLLGHYAQLMVVPWRLSIDYGLSVLGSVADWRDPYLYVGMATAVAGVGLLALALRGRQWGRAFCLIAAGITYAMISNVILIGTIFNEHLMYLPSVFLLIWAASYLAELSTGQLAAVLTVIVAVGSVRTVSYAARWHDRYQFYVTSLAEQPRSIRLHEMLAMEMMENRGDLAGAAAVAADGIRVAPQYWNVWVMAGRIAEREGDVNQALAYYRKAFKLHPVLPLDNLIKKLSSSTRPANAGQ